MARKPAPISLDQWWHDTFKCQVDDSWVYQNLVNALGEDLTRSLWPLYRGALKQSWSTIGKPQGATSPSPETQAVINAAYTANGPSDQILKQFDTMARIDRAMEWASALFYVQLREIVFKLRMLDYSWEFIGQMLGISKSAAHQRYADYVKEQQKVLLGLSERTMKQLSAKYEGLSDPDDGTEDE